MSQDGTMRTIGVYNVKGGVGKTATAVNIAWEAARAGHRVLLWDLDSQGAACWYLGLEPRLSVNVGKLLKRKHSLAEQTQATDFPGLEVLPADEALRHLDLMLEQTKNPKRTLSSLLGELASRYDVAVLDCPPTFSRTSEGIFRAADALLVPVVPSPLSIRALARIQGYFDERRRYHRAALHPFFSMVDRRRTVHRQWLLSPPDTLGNLLAAYVPYAADVERMGLQRRPVGCYAPRSAAAAAYRAIWRELASRLDIAR